jgi:hypothetical protein
MALITSYATLQTAIGDYLNRSDLTTFLPNFTQACENKLYKNLRIRAMENQLAVTIAAGVAAVPTSPAYLELKYAYVTTSPVTKLHRIPPDQIYERFPVRSGSNIPKFISVEASSFIFGPYPGNYTINGVYYGRLTALGAGNTTNWFTDNAPDLLLYGSLLEAAPFLHNDERLVTWKALYDLALKAVKDEETRQKSSGGSLATRVA